MAAKTINGDSSVGMAFLAKAFFAEHTFGFRIGMTVNTIFQAVLRGTNTLAQGFITLVNNELHVLFAHDVGFPYAFVTLCCDFRMRFQRTVLVVFIAVLGLVGLIAFTIQKRMKELAIRKILGATKRQILVLFGKSFFIQAMIALVIATPVTYHFMQTWLEDFAYRISVTGIEFFFAFLVLIVILSSIVFLQVGRSADINPVETLRYE